MIYIFAFAFGIDNALFRQLPYPLLFPLPLASFIALLYNIFNVKLLFGLFLRKKLYALMLLGTIMALIRYYFYYKDHGFMFFPIIRQAAAFCIGWNFFITGLILFKKKRFKDLSIAILSSSIFFLVYGIYQKFQNYQVGGYNRITSMFTEPSYYGDYLVLMVLPFLIYQLLNFKLLSKLTKAMTMTAAPLWILNFMFVQSGTALVKCASLIFFFILLYPQMRLAKAVLAVSATVIISTTIFSGDTYTKYIVGYAVNMLEDPSLFIENHTFYDRIYPIYAAFKSLFSLQGIFGLGFGGDYYEFKNLFPASTHAEQLYQKPSMSFFNSFASKFILFFGFSGFVWLAYQFKNCFKVKNLFIKIGLANVLFASLWGIANFSLPYFWFWLALASNDEENSNNESDDTISKDAAN